MGHVTNRATSRVRQQKWLASANTLMELEVRLQGEAKRAEDSVRIVGGELRFASLAISPPGP